MIPLPTGNLRKDRNAVEGGRASTPDALLKEKEY